MPIGQENPAFLPYFNCVNTDQYSVYGSTKLLNTDPIWIRIHKIGVGGVKNFYTKIKNM